MRAWLLMWSILVAWSNTAGAITEDTLTFGKFGTTHLYRGEQVPNQIVIFVSGDGGWNGGVVEMAKALSKPDALVIGVDIRRYLTTLQQSPESCLYPSADFEELSQYLQKKLNLPEYHLPVLVGYSSGATLVYAVLAESPPNTFAGGISVGFCPDLPSIKPFCKGYGLISEPEPHGKGFIFRPAKRLSAPWIVFQGKLDQVCDPKLAAQYARLVPGARLIDLPKVGHGFSNEKNWLPQFISAYQSITEAAKRIELAEEPLEITDLPLVQLPANSDSGTLMACIVTGDGGWASIDRDIGTVLSQHGIPVVGLNSLKYFWQRRSPDEAGSDLTRILRLFLHAWKKQEVVLIGYSRGADVLPFMASRLPDDLRNRVRLIALLGPSRSVDFQFHLVDFISDKSRKSDFATLPEINKLSDLKVICFCGSDEKNSVCRDVDTTTVRVITLRGGHHFDNDYVSIAQTILQLTK